MNEPGALPLPDLKGRTALITGAGRGIGRAIAIDLAAAGAVVAIVARSERQLADTIFEIGSDGHECDAMAFVRDLADLDATKSLVPDVERELGPIDILINNAAVVSPLGPTESLEPSEVQHSLQLNVVAPVVLSAMVIPSMRQRRWGRIVNVSSGVVAKAGAMLGGNTYTFTKSALESHTLNLAAELEQSGITVNVYRPGRVDTAMQQWIRDHHPDRVGGGLVERFRAFDGSGELITPQASARSLVARLNSIETGHVCDVADDLIVPAAG